MLNLFKHTRIIATHINKRLSSTIFALSSGYGKCGVAVIRVSGNDAPEAFKKLGRFKELPTPRKALLRSIVHPQTNEILDKGLMLWFPGPNSFTGENSFELHIHGGTAVINSVLDALNSIPNTRLAEPGEFTKRAFYNGKLDLTEVEGLADLLQAETEAQRKQAFLQMQGALSDIYKAWQLRLKKCLANIEADIDFAETEAIEENLISSVQKEVLLLCSEIQKHLKDGRKGEILRNGVRTVIIGEPNVGKSSLMNILCQRPAAIVTPIEGTTRDVLEVTLNINGYPLVLTDTAGLRSQTNDVIEQEGIHRAMKTFKKSDLIILVIDAKKFLKWTKANGEDFMEYLKHYIASLKLDLLKSNVTSLSFTKPCLLVINKTDLCNSFKALPQEVVRISCTKNEGIDDLIQQMTSNLKTLCGEPNKEHPCMNQSRHRQHLMECLNSLQLFLEGVPKGSDSSADTVLLAENLRKALRHLGKLVGAVTTEELLDMIFSNFCIGK